MKRVLIITILMLAAALAQAQDTPGSVQKKSSDTATANCIAAEFPGGLDSMNSYLSRNLQYPIKARACGIEGTVTVSFVVEKDGSISNVTVTQDIGGGCGEEAARVIANMPRWTPGTVDGAPVRCKYSQTLTFHLYDKTSMRKRKSRERNRNR